MAGQLFITTVSPAALALVAAGMCSTPSCIQTV